MHTGKHSHAWKLLTPLLLLAGTSGTLASSALSVPTEYKQVIAGTIAEADAIAFKKQAAAYRAEAAQYADNAGQEARRAEQAAADAQDQLAAAQLRLEQAEPASTDLADAWQVFSNTRLYAQNAASYALAARAAATQAEESLAALVKLQETPYQAHYFSTGARYYAWQKKAGQSGHQFLQPLSYGYWSKKFAYGLFGYRASSHAPGGSVNTFTDTLLLFASRNEHDKFTLDYSFSINLPTGKSALNWPQRYARMNEDIVEIEQFGKGWQFTPGLAVSWRPHERDIWTVGTYYIHSLSYDPTVDIANDNVRPGGEWNRFLRYQHAGQKWQLAVELHNTAYGRTRVGGGGDYKSNDLWRYRLTYNRRLDEKQDLKFYYWPEKQARNYVPRSAENSYAHYYGSMWSYKYDAKRTLRVSLDIMQTHGMRYNGIYNYYDATGPHYMADDVRGRRKTTFGLGYDYKINARSSLSLDLQYFRMKDGESTIGQPASNYKGYNLFFLYTRSL